MSADTNSPADRRAIMYSKKYLSWPLQPLGVRLHRMDLVPSLVLSFGCLFSEHGMAAPLSAAKYFHLLLFPLLECSLQTALYRPAL
jgi:hypothetical protein